MEITCTVHSITFKLGDEIKEKVKKLPHGYGAFKIYANSKEGELLYIGKAGTVLTDGEFKKQDLPKRLTMKQDDIYRQEFFTQQLQEHAEYEQLYIECYYLEDNSVLPAYLRAKFIQEYFQDHKKLPLWNKNF